MYNIFMRGLGTLDQEFPYLLILNESGEELHEFAIVNEISTINLF